MISLTNIEKKAVFDSDATALASMVLPQPGGPNSSTPDVGLVSPVNKSGRRDGRTTASYKARLAVSSPLMSDQATPGDCALHFENEI